MGDADLQFDHAEYEATSAVECAICKQSVTRYYEANGKQLCERCKDGLTHWRPGTPGHRFWRALALGTGAAAIGTVLYLAVMKITGLELGLMAIVVGVGVGMAVRKGSYNMGGAGYQVMAILLTWLSISATYYVVILEGISKTGPIAQGGHLMLVPIALGVPFIEAADGNILGLIIVGFGLWEAWRFNRRPQLLVTGPFEVMPPAPAPLAPAPDGDAEVK